MLKKGSKLNSILTGSCPRCQKESMYVVKNPYHIKTVLDMNESCSHCGLHYQIEPSFFYGAMYVSYAYNVALAVASFIIGFVFLKLPLKQTFIALILTIVVMTPLILRLSRNSYINMFISYDEKYKDKA